MCSEIVYIAGRYNKYLRNLSQSPWIDKDDVRIKQSVQELIEDGLKEYLQFGKTIFSSSGREDVDVRMLGAGRPFVFKIVDPFNVDNYNKETMRKIQKFINDKHKRMVKVSDLQVVTKQEVSNNIKLGEESKTKEYRALCCCSRRLNQTEIENFNKITDLDIDQKTPIRVLHRRTLASRRRRIYRLNIDPVELDDFVSVKKENIDNLFCVTLLTEAGTYIKEFVHGDFGRTKPSLSDLLGDCDTDLVELDVMEVYLEWPPKINENITASAPTESEMDRIENPVDVSELNLAKLYSNGFDAMKKAESMSRSEARQDLYNEARKNFERALDLIDRLSLFSHNEQIDDVATNDVKYLLVPAYLAKVLLSAECSPNRLETFTKVESYLKMFLHRILKYGLGDRGVEMILSFDTLEDKTSTISLEQAMQNRTKKIEKFKRMKTLELQIEELNRRINTNESVDDEVVREYYLNLLRKWIEESCDCLEQEVRPAIFFERNRSEASSSSHSDKKPKVIPIDPSKSMTIVKDNFQKAVFGLGYPSRPTVTVDEFISKKISDGDLVFNTHKEVYANSLQRYAEQPTLLRDQEEQSDEEREKKEEHDDEDELAKKRNWDEFKDENPRGSGNRHNMG